MWTEVVPVVMSVLTPLAAAVAWWVRRADKREDRMIKNLERQLAEEKARTAAAEERARVAKAAGDEKARMWERRATLWHGQLLENKIKPKPMWGESV